MDKHLVVDFNQVLETRPPKYKVLWDGKKYTWSKDEILAAVTSSNTTPISIGNGSSSTQMTTNVDNLVSDMYWFILFYLLVTSKTKFINFTTQRVDDKLSFFFKTSETPPVYLKPIYWNRIACEQLNENIKSNCYHSDSSSLSGLKIFVRFHRLHMLNFFHYVKALRQGKISKKDHDMVWNLITDVLRKDTSYTVINDNLEVNKLHFKFLNT